MMRPILAMIALTSVLAASVACGPPPRRTSVSGSLDDATITVRVKTALLNDPAVGALKIDVATSEGVVTLSGTVKSSNEEQAALTLARKVEGVRDVKSTLKIEQ
jgi:hyperosmotically inducible periplasmic protein